MKKWLISLLLLCLLTVPAFAEEGGDPPLAPDLYLTGNPTTGYSWFAEVDEPTVLAVTDNGYVQDEGEGVGVGGVFQFRLDGLKEGMAKVTFRYARAWETEEAPLCELSYDVYVSEDLDTSIYSINVNPGL
ncbi:MAG: protease inhibitor I42 family protein [Eubacteriales bacterium]|nr:protease inhibitor I42 family protein [Eubacteriales bacterium]